MLECQSVHKLTSSHAHTGNADALVCALQLGEEGSNLACTRAAIRNRR